jgi:drug/metabolite transporter (DMT)-like permease
MRAPAPPRSDRFVALVCLLVTGGLFGVSTTLAKLAPAAGLAPLPFVAWSVTGAALVLLAVNAARGIGPRKDAASLRYALVTGFITIAAPFVLMFAAIPHVGAGFMSLAIAFPPLFTYLGALALGLERYHAVRALGVLLALAGAAWIAVMKFAAPDGPVIWIVAALGVPLILAVGNLYRTLHWPAGARPEELAPPMMTAAAVKLLVAGAFLPGASLAIPLDRGAAMLLVAAYTATLSLQYLIYFVLQKRGGPVYLSLLGSVAAVVGVPLAVLVLDESPPRGLAIGATLIALGIAAMTWAAGRVRK